jgi:hypothetical protein
MVSIAGAVERIDGARIAGWARSADGNPALTINILSDEIVIGSGVPGIPRHDLGGDHGFEVDCAAPIDPMHVLAGRVSVVASLGASFSPLRILSAARSRVLAQIVAVAMQDFDLDDIDRVREAIANLPNALDAEHIAVRHTPEKERTLRLLEQAGVRPDAPATTLDLTAVPVQTGFVSPDGTALMGHDGEAYLVGGGNRVLEQFLTSPDDPEVERLVAAWHAAILERARLVAARGGRFLQVIIPEKLSASPERFPAKVPTPSPLLRHLEARLAASEAAACTVFGLRELRAAMPSARIFARFDTHLTLPAVHALFTAQLRAMGLANPFPLDRSVRRLYVGDLARRFFGVPLYEEYEAPSQGFTDSISGCLELVVREVPPEGHIGTRFVWRNAAAPFDLKVVAFANSFFERGGSAGHLSWWCCRAFREFHFIWLPDMDMGYVRQEAPDWVICQTIERFLPRSPQDHG